MELNKIVKRDNNGVWVKFEGDSEILINPLTPKEMQDITKSCTKINWKSGKIVDDDALNKKLNTKIVLDWKNFSMDGEEFKCTPENIRLLMENCLEFNTFVQHAATNIQEYREAEKVEEIKN